jgi:trehalose 6-phosphate phosphatase
MATNRASFDAVILDLDGVITRTAHLHAEAWKRMFDEYLTQRATSRNEVFEPFDADADYRRYVDGKPRYDGVRSFLEARDIELPEGNPSDDPSRETICGLGNQKNAMFHRLVAERGVEVFDDALQRIREWRSQSLKLAVVSSSKNCASILEAAGLSDLFDVRVDGVESARLSLKGKPAPDTFLEAARRLGVSPESAVLIEDAVAGVQAGRAGHFGLVVGVDRDGDGHALRENGADVTVRSLDELQVQAKASNGHVTGLRRARDLPSALECHRVWMKQLDDRKAVLFLDYDGTLTPIVSRPEDALISDGMRAVLSRLGALYTVAIVSGRDREDVETLVSVVGLIYVGSHGFDISGPAGLRLEHEAGLAALPDLDRAERVLRDRLAQVEGAQVERKRFSVAVHYRNVAERDTRRVERIVDEVHRAHHGLRKTGGKKVFELRPDVDWDKGKAIFWILEALNLDTPNVLPIYLGDDLTDEDAFAALRGHGIGILVGDHGDPTAADFRLDNVDEVERLLRELIRARGRDARATPESSTR